MGHLASTIFTDKYSMEGKERWEDTAFRTVNSVVGPYFPDLVPEITALVSARKFMPGGRYLRNSGRPVHQVNNCMLFRVDDSREGWAGLMQRATLALMTGAGIGVVYSELREEGAPVRGQGGTSTGPLALMQMINEAGRHIMQGGSRRSAIWAGLHWNHPDVFKFIHVKDWKPEVVALKEKDYSHPAPMDITNISVILDDDFFAAYDDPDSLWHEWADRLYNEVIEQMLRTGEPGFSIDVGENAGENLRNACTEITSADDNDVCNLGSLNLARIDSVEEMERATELATVFLLCGTLYSMLPFEEVEETRTKNRRLGLGLMGIYDWLAVRGKPYAPDGDLARMLEQYERSGEYADKYADILGITRPVKTRALAPNGTIGIIAEVAGSGCEPVYSLAIKRRYLKNGKTWVFQYVIDASAQRLIDKGVAPESLDTAFELAKDPERRVLMQAWLQRYVDHGISSTLNLPSFKEQRFTPREFGDMLMRYLPHLRGITAYPNGARGGQPLNAVPYEEALQQIGVELEETSNEHACVDGVCGV